MANALWSFYIIWTLWVVEKFSCYAIRKQKHVVNDTGNGTMTIVRALSWINDER